MCAITGCNIIVKNCVSYIFQCVDQRWPTIPETLEAALLDENWRKNCSIKKTNFGKNCIFRIQFWEEKCTVRNRFSKCCTVRNRFWKKWNLNKSIYEISAFWEMDFGKKCIFQILFLERSTFLNYLGKNCPFSIRLWKELHF